MQLAELEFVREDIPSAINQTSLPDGTREFIQRAYPKNNFFFFRYRDKTFTDELLNNIKNVLYV